MYGWWVKSILMTKSEIKPETSNRICLVGVLFYSELVAICWRMNHLLPAPSTLIFCKLVALIRPLAEVGIWILVPGMVMVCCCCWLACAACWLFGVVWFCCWPLWWACCCGDYLVWVCCASSDRKCQAFVRQKRRRHFDMGMCFFVCNLPIVAFADFVRSNWASSDWIAGPAATAFAVAFVVRSRSLRCAS